MAFNHKHLIDITEYSADDIMTVLETAVRFKEVNERRIKQVPTLKGVTVVNMFNEPSTRTRSSFEIAERQQPELRRQLHLHGEGRKPRGHGGDAVRLQDRHDHRA